MGHKKVKEFSDLVVQLHPIDPKNHFTYPPKPKRLAFVFNEMVNGAFQTFKDEVDNSSPNVNQYLEIWPETSPPIEGLKVRQIPPSIGKDERMMGKFAHGKEPSIAWNGTYIQEVKTFQGLLQVLPKLWSTAFHECIHLEQYLSDPEQYLEGLEDYPEEKAWNHPYEAETVAYGSAMGLLNGYLGKVEPPKNWGKEGCLEDLLSKISGKAGNFFYFAMMENEEVGKRNYQMVKKLMEDGDFPTSIAAQGWKKWIEG